MHVAVQELEKEGAKAISLQQDDPSKFHEWHDSGGVMGELEGGKACCCEGKRPSQTSFVNPITIPLCVCARVRVQW